MRGLSVLLVVVLGSLANTASAGIVFDIVESGGNVEVSMSGSLDLDATQGFVSNSTGFNGYLASGGNLSTGTGNSDYYGVDVLSWTAFGTGGFGIWSSSSGDPVHLFGNPYIGVPVGYVSGTALSASMTSSGATFSSLGFTPGSYVTTLANQAASDTVTVNIGATPVPETATLALFGLGLVGVVAWRRRNTK